MKLASSSPQATKRAKPLLELLQHPQDQLQDEKQHFFSAALGGEKNTNEFYLVKFISFSL